MDRLALVVALALPLALTSCVVASGGNNPADDDGARDAAADGR